MHLLLKWRHVPLPAQRQGSLHSSVLVYGCLGFAACFALLCLFFFFMPLPRAKGERSSCQTESLLFCLFPGRFPLYHLLAVIQHTEAVTFVIVFSTERKFEAIKWLPSRFSLIWPVFKVLILLPMWFSGLVICLYSGSIFWVWAINLPLMTFWPDFCHMNWTIVTLCCSPGNPVLSTLINPSTPQHAPYSSPLVPAAPQFTWNSLSAMCALQEQSLPPSQDHSTSQLSLCCLGL